MRVALNKYREQEETYQHELERRVEQRTSELSQSRDYLMKTNRNLAALNAVAGILSRSLDLNEVLNGSLDRVLEAMGATAGGIFLLDAEESALVLMTQRGLPQEVAASLNRLSRQEIFHGKRTTAPRMGSPDWIAAGRKIMAERLQVNSFACVPLEAKGKVLGGLFLSARNSPPRTLPVFRWKPKAKSWGDYFCRLEIVPPGLCLWLPAEHRRKN